MIQEQRGHRGLEESVPELTPRERRSWNTSGAVTRTGMIAGALKTSSRTIEVTENCMLKKFHMTNTMQMIRALRNQLLKI